MSIARLHTLNRKARQLSGDKVLRRWLWGRMLGRWPGGSNLAPKRPPYLAEYPPAPSTVKATASDFFELPDSDPMGELVLPLAGEKIRLSPGGEHALMTRDFADTETLLGLHRFAWLPIMGDDVDPAWVSALWRAWRGNHGSARSGWPWHPYPAAERVINILDYAGRHGLPGPRDDTLQFLAGHGETIEASLEYFSESNTGNHLSNNGRGLFLLGLALGIERFANIGGRILIEEGARIFGASGMLREGSSHYHLLLTRNYASAWLAARAHDRPETVALQDITRRALAALPGLVLPGGMPLIGDISPDCPPDFLAGLLPGADQSKGWTGLRTAEEKQALIALADSTPAETGTAGSLEQDGWWRFDTGPWAALWNVAPDGWSAMPGHGHQDLGGFEVHFNGVAIFRDPGRGAYGDDGEAAEFVSARAHNALMIDDAEPYPPNKPYYDAAFRRGIDGAPPTMLRNADGFTLTHRGFSRIKGVGAATRVWRFDADAMVVTDHIEGAGKHRVVRRLHTTLPVERAPGGAMIEGAGRRFLLTCDGAVTIEKSKCWTAYGDAVAATAINIAMTEALPLETSLTVDAV
jgi:hypothetical protein